MDNNTLDRAIAKLKDITWEGNPCFWEKRGNESCTAAKKRLGEASSCNQCLTRMVIAELESRLEELTL